ncbi:MAG: Xaa-Pro peptidase family protein [Acidimicrobiales bacterium]
MTSRPAVVLPPLGIGPRIDRLRAALDPAGCDALVVTNLTNVRYLTGFTGSAGLLIVTDTDAVLITDGRYETQVVEQVAASGAPVAVEITTNEQRRVASGAVGARARVGLESHSVTWAQQRSYQEWFEPCELVATDLLVELLRATKDDGELARIEAAAAIADAALGAIRRRLLDGPTEAEFGLELDTEMRRRGASGSAFETIIASGPNSAKAHHRPSTRQVQPGDFVIIDFGAIVDGYRSDMTRTVVVGEPSAEQQRVYDAVAGAQAAGVAAVIDGVQANEVDRACRDYITERGWGDRFVHGTGHGVGLDIHEAPWVNTRTTATLQAGHVVTVEPGVYLPDFGGVRVEDTVIVTPSGCRPLTHTAKDPVVA